MTKPEKYGCLADQPHKLLHPNYSGQSHRSAREAFGASLPTQGDGSRPVADDYKGVLIFVVIILFTLAICHFFIHPFGAPQHDKPHHSTPAGSAGQRTATR